MPYDVLGNALNDYHQNLHVGDITTYSSMGDEDVLPLAHLFRSYNEMPLLEQKALQSVKGKILDIGCGAGSHCLYLQNNGFNVTGIDISKGAVEVAKKRGVEQVIHTDLLSFTGAKFDTLLLLMNGIGIVGRLKLLSTYLDHLKSLLKPNGQILLDSSDIIYMFDKDEDGGHWIPGHLDYYGEVQFQMSYNQENGPIFDWLYVDFNTLAHYAEKQQLACELLAEGNHYDYLAKLSLA